MEFAALVAPGGAFWRAWVAAHWERRLKRSDYIAADVKAIAAQVVQRLGAISLRCAGCLLLGICRILRWKVIQLEDEAQEVRSGLLNSASAGPGLPVVATLPESALTLRPVGDVPWWVPEVEFDNSEPLQLLEAPQLPLKELRASLEEGKRHVAPLETITLGRVAPRPPPASASAGPADAFGVPSAEEREAMEALGRQAGAEEPPPPPLDFLLGQSGGAATAFDLQMPSGDLVPSGRAWMGGSVGGLGQRGLEEDDLFPLEDPLSASPRRLVKRLEEEFDTPSARVGMGDPGFPRPSAQSSYLARMLDFSPDAQDLPMASVAEDAGEGTFVAAAAAAQPPKKRRRRPKPWLDEVTEIPKSRYHDTASITRQTNCDYSLFLPHQAFHLGFTTPYTDLCQVLCEPFLQARHVGQKRREAMALATSSAAASSSTAPAPASQSQHIPGQEGGGNTALALAVRAASVTSAGHPTTLSAAPPDAAQHTPHGDGDVDPPHSGPGLEQGPGPGPGPGEGQDDLDELVPPWPGLPLPLPMPGSPSQRSGASPARSLADPGLGLGLGGPGLDPVLDPGLGLGLQYSPLPPAPFSPLGDAPGEGDADGEGEGEGEGGEEAGRQGTQMQSLDLGPAVGTGMDVDVDGDVDLDVHGGVGLVLGSVSEPELDAPGDGSVLRLEADEREGEGEGGGEGPTQPEEPPSKVRRRAEGQALENEDADAGAGAGVRVGAGAATDVAADADAAAAAAAQAHAEAHADAERGNPRAGARGHVGQLEHLEALQSSLGPLQQEVSLNELCESSQWQADEVAQNFLGLLSLHMEGIVSLSQDEPYGDIAIGRGLDWPASAMPTPGSQNADA